MESKYQEWIDGYIAEGFKVNGRCKEVTEEMKTAFPELERVRGHVHMPCIPERGHWWLVTNDGTIIDPTVSQFSDPNYIYGGGKKPIEYEPLPDDFEEPKGKCMECGDISYYTSHACSRNCEIALECAFR